MATLGWIGRLCLAAAAVSLSIVMVQPAVGAPTVKGDAAAWAEIVAALKKQRTVSYRAKSTTGPTDNTPGISEFVPPNTKHTIVPGLLESFSVGNKYWVRGIGDRWDCSLAVKGPLVGAPVWDQQGEVTAKRIPALVIGGMATRGYTYMFTGTVNGRTVTGNQRLYVAVQTGLPRRAVVEEKLTFDFYDYGAKITITPPCG
jgi:hypothetical protein